MSKKSAKSKSQTKEKLFGAEGFEQYYGELYGERWQALKDSFAGEGSSVEYHVTGAEKSYFLDSASVLAALCLPLTNLAIDPVFGIMGAVEGVEYTIDPLEVFVSYPLIILAATALSAFLTALYTKTVKASDTANIE